MINRAAERFNDLLEDDRTNTHTELSPLMSLAQQMESIGSSVRADDDFREQFRTRLMAVAAVQGVGNENTQRAPRTSYQGSRRKDSRRMPRRFAILAGTLAALVGLSSVGMASGNANPGDPLYGVKRSKESAKLAFARSDLSRGQLYLDFARTRLNEAQNLNGLNGISKALDDADSDTRNAVRELGEAAIDRDSTAPLDAVDRFVNEQRSDLQTWASKQSRTKQARALESLSLLDQVTARSQGLRASLSCSNGNAGPNTSDSLGPVPRACAATPTAKTSKPARGANTVGPNKSNSSSNTPNPSPSPSPTDGQLPLNSDGTPKLLDPDPSPSPAKPGNNKDIGGWLGGIFATAK